MQDVYWHEFYVEVAGVRLSFTPWTLILTIAAILVLILLATITLLVVYATRPSRHD
jgi:hypothetical protein